MTWEEHGIELWLRADDGRWLGCVKPFTWTYHGEVQHDWVAETELPGLTTGSASKEWAMQTLLEHCRISEAVRHAPPLPGSQRWKEFEEAGLDPRTTPSSTIVRRRVTSTA